MQSLAAYIPIDRRQAMAEGKSLPDRTHGAVLFADISGFTPLTELLARELGPRRGAEELTQQLNAIYGLLIAEVHRYHGAVIGFSGDAITCWFDGDDGLRATACAFAMQHTIRRLAGVKTPSGRRVSLAIKAAVAGGPVRRFLVGDPQIQTMDVLAGATLDRMARAEKQAQKGEVVLTSQVVAQLSHKVQVLEWRVEAGSGQRFAVVSGLASQVEPAPWPTLPLEEQLSAEWVKSWLLPPVYARLRGGQGRFLAEIRPAVPLFLRFSGIEYDQDPTAGEKLDLYIRWVQNVLARYEGYLIQLTTGDKGSYLYAVFGAPLAHDDDPARAVAAALELRASPDEMDFLAEVQIGISQGRMRAGAYGGPTRCTYGVLGDEVNVAARLMGQARPGQALASKRIADAAGRASHFQYLGPVEIQGKEHPLHTYIVRDGPLPLARRPSPVFAHPLVGREKELAQIERVLQAVLAGRGHIVRLEGAAGIGKSRLAAELTERGAARGFRVALGTCQSIGQAIAYHPWRQVFHALFELEDQPLEKKELGAWTMRQVARIGRLVGEADPDWLVRLPILGDLLGLSIPDNATTRALSPEARQQSLLALMAALVQSWARERPLLLLIDDAQWMDEASGELAAILARAIAGVPVLLTLVHRPTGPEDRLQLSALDELAYHQHLYLHELLPGDISVLATHRLEGELSALALSLIGIQAQGNPFFAEELVDSLRESESLFLRENGTWTLSEALKNSLRASNHLARANGEWVMADAAPPPALDLGIPDTITGIVLSRIDRLPEPDKLTLKVASVIGHTFPLDLLSQSHPARPGQEILLQQLALMQARDLIHLASAEPRPAYAFKHHLTQEVTYSTLLDDQRQDLHQAVGQATESLAPAEVERLAYHYYRSRRQDKALFYLEKAAGKARREYANETALNYYNQALILEERWQWFKAKAEILHLLGRRDEEREALSLLEQTPEAPVSDVFYPWGQYYEALGNYTQAHAAVEQARNAYRDMADTVNEARCLAQLGLIARRQGEYGRARDWYDQALDCLGRAGGHPDVEIQVLNDLGIIHRQQGNYDEARANYRRALARSRASGNRMGEARALNNLGVVAFYQRDFTRALTRYRQALKIRRAIGDRVGEGASLFDLAVAIRELGDYSQAQEYFLEALLVQQTTGNRWEEVNVWNSLGVLYLLLGDLASAQSCLQRGLELSREIGDEAGQAYLLCNLGQVVRDQGKLADARHMLEHGLALARAQADRYLEAIYLSHLGITALRGGALEEAADWASQALTMRQELKLRLWTTTDLGTLAEAHLARGEISLALDYAQQVLAILEECGGQGPEFPQRDYFVCYRVFAAAHRSQAARNALRSAYDLVMARSEKISDPALRGFFLQQVKFNQDILREYEAGAA